MGIKGAHSILSPASQRASWTELTAIKGLLDPNGLLVGIDASPLMESAQRSLHQRHQQAGTNGPLKDLFRLLGRLSQYAVAGVFVFDGPERPKIKRKKNVSFKPHALTEPFQELITAFGFYYHQAPGEADAELAAMNRLHAIDMVLSTDSDLIVFGASVVGRNPKLMEAFPSVMIYSRDRIEEKLNITWGGLILFALAAGGDYDKGLPTCGPRIASALARTRLGDELVDAFGMLSQADFVIFRAEWQQSLRIELATNKSGALPYRCSTLAKSIPSDFPTYRVLSLYLSPPVSTSFDRSAWAFPPRSFCMQNLVELYQKRFWPAHDLLAVFGKHVIPGMVVRQLICSIDDPSDGNELIAKIGRRLPKDPLASELFPSYSVKVDISATLEATHGLAGLANIQNVKIPGLLLSMAKPALLATPFPTQSLLADYQYILPMSRGWSLSNSRKFSVADVGEEDGGSDDVSNSESVLKDDQIISISDSEDEEDYIIISDSEDEEDLTVISDSQEAT